MRSTQRLRIGALAVLALGAGATGCTHNYYYGAVPPCAEPATVVGSTGTACDPPTQVVSGGIVTTPGASQSAVVAGTPRVIVSQPQRRRFSWRASDPETLATNRLEGAIGEDSVSR